MTFGIKLKPRYSNQKDFYGKAKVVEEDGKKVLISYQTKVAEINNGQAKVFGLYSNTTTRHIKEFLQQNGFKVESSKQILADYGTTDTPKSDKSDLKSVYGVAKMGELMFKDEKEKNAYQKRILEAGLKNKGLSFPEDWDSLSEKEKSSRLNKAMEELK